MLNMLNMLDMLDILDILRCGWDINLPNSLPWVLFQSETIQIHCPGCFLDRESTQGNEFGRFLIEKAPRAMNLEGLCPILLSLASWPGQLGSSWLGRHA